MKKLWLAVLLNFLLGGAAYLYLGRRRLFGVLVIIGFVVWGVDSLVTPMSVGEVAADLILAGAFAYDGYREAKEVNRLRQ